MLAKVWKKALLAVCIIACLYNVMHKLVSRTSLEVQLRSVQNQTSLPNISQEDEKNNNLESRTTINTNPVNDEESEEEDTIVVIY